MAEGGSTLRGKGARGPVGVGIVGLSTRGGWAARAHLPAIRELPDRFAPVALCGSTPQAAAAAAERFDIPFHTHEVEALADRPEVDLVVVSVKVPEHRRLVRAALDAGKAVYCEWPLGRDVAEAEEMAAWAKHAGVRCFAGLQGRTQPALARAKALIADGYLGAILSTSVVAAVGSPWDGSTDTRRAYLNRRANGATMLTIPFGHAFDALTWLLGDFASADATLAVRRPDVLVKDTGAPMRSDVADHIAAAGRLTSGAVASIHYRGGLSPGSNFRWEINGAAGDLVLAGGDGHLQFGLATLTGARRGAAAYETLCEPASAAPSLTPMYRALCDDLADGGNRVPNFGAAARLHAELARIEAGADAPRS